MSRSIAESVSLLSETLGNCKTNLKEKGVEADTIKISDVDEKIAEIQATNDEKFIILNVRYSAIETDGNIEYTKALLKTPSGDLSYSYSEVEETDSNYSENVGGYITDYKYIFKIPSEDIKESKFLDFYIDDRVKFYGEIAPSGFYISYNINQCLKNASTQERVLYLATQETNVGLVINGSATNVAYKIDNSKVEIVKKGTTFNLSNYFTLIRVTNPMICYNGDLVGTANLNYSTAYNEPW